MPSSLSPEEKRVYDRGWYARLPLERKARKVGLQRLRVKRIGEFVADYKQQLGCSRCNEIDPVCLDLHHKSDDKEINVADAVRNGWSLERLGAELEKCIVICANCHRKLHAGFESRRPDQPRPNDSLSFKPA